MAISYNTSIVRNGLVLHLDAANVKSYPGTGTVWNDLSGNGNNGSLLNGVGYSSNNSGIMSFDGTNDYVETASSINMDFASFSVLAWFKTTQSADAKIFSNSITYHPIQTYNGTMRTCVNGCTIGTTVINDGVWRLATVVGDTTSIRLYLNNNTAPEITQAKTTTTTNTVPNIGKAGDMNAYYFSGDISQVSVYSRALSVNEIQQNFNAMRGRYNV